MPIDYEKTLSHFKIQKRHNDNRMQAFCPAHDDKNASLSILISDKKILLFCHAGCKVEDILKASGLTYSDLFLDTKPPIAIYQYRNADGTLSHEKVKYKTPQGKRFSQRRIEGDGISENLDGIPRIPYNYPQVLEAIKLGKTILYVEGEKDSETARLLGYVGTTMGGASDWKDEYKHFFKGAIIVLIPDKDDAGMKLANKSTKSFSEVCKSLKVIILPDGKDLTEWVEAGNSDLKSIIYNTPELITNKGIPEPKMTVLPGRYDFDWNGLNLKITIDRIRNDNEGEISVLVNDKPIYISGISLLSVSHKTALARVLKTQRQLDWDMILNQVATKTLSHIRQGEDVIWLNSDYGKQKPNYLIYPLFVENAVNIIYADKSSAKSLFMTFIDLILDLGYEYAGLHSDRRKTLFLDWENDPYITGWQKECLLRGLGIDGHEVAYLRCKQPLVSCVDHIRSKIIETEAEVVIIDSLGMAVGDDLNLTKPAFEFYGALRQLPVTPIIIAHTSKDINNRRKTVYGNAYYENEARSVWEVNKEQSLGANELTLTLHHRKAPPFSGYQEPLAWKFIFEGDTTTVEITTPSSDKREVMEERTIEDKILNVLLNSPRPLTRTEILKTSKEPIRESSIGKTIERMVKSSEPLIGKDLEGKYYAL